jgi:hypothetical protein
MMRRELILLIVLTAGRAVAQMTLNPPSTTLEGGKTVTFSVKNAASGEKITWGITSDLGGNWVPADDSADYTAPSTVGTDRKAIVTATDTKGHSATAEITLKGAPPPVTDSPTEWESRSVVGFQQAAASGSDPRQAFFLDFFIERGLNSVSAIDDRWVLWGNVRLASVPTQVNPPVSSLTKDLGTAAKALKVNELVQSAEFVAGLEYRLLQKTNTSRTVKRDIGLLVQYGATGPLTPKQTLQIFDIPDPKSPQRQTFEGRYGTPPANVTYVGFLGPDRGSFYKQWGMGFRVTTFDLGADGKQRNNSPATFTFTFGQDQLVTAGHYHGISGKFDVFYPLPLPIENGNNFKFIYLFGTASIRFSGRPSESDALVLNQAPAGTNGYDANVMLVTTTSNRDTYRIGVGLDVLSVLQKMKVVSK